MKESNSWECVLQDQQAKYETSDTCVKQMEVSRSAFLKLLDQYEEQHGLRLPSSTKKLNLYGAVICEKNYLRGKTFRIILESEELHGIS